MIKISILLFVVLSFIACEKNPDQLLRSGDVETALVIYKDLLNNDYDNIELRRKIIRIYFSKAESLKKIDRFDEAARMLEKGMIYSHVSDSEIILEYGKYLCEIGKSCIEKAQNSDDFDKNSLTTKGVRFIKQSIDQGYSDGKEILKMVDSEAAAIYFKEAESKIEMWKSNKDKRLLESAEDLLSKSENLNYNKSRIRELKDKILSNELFINESIDSISISLEEIRFNGNDLLLKVKYSDNRNDGFRMFDPERFEIITSKNNLIQPEKEAYKTYSGVMQRRRVNAGSSYSGYIVFSGLNKNTKIRELRLSSSLGEIFVKEFPSIPLKDITRD
ncbi:MAG: tetratricopeptide repeat protein [Candidatus Delongbacteria bacterium]|nr:tetratricopeptide repeat protein [Candidatus Delongbacteria bacterium]MBN2833959.1 tetratricopeptide repeat protein [Candidatus Delongbacteria bacterium]